MYVYANRLKLIMYTDQYIAVSFIDFRAGWHRVQMYKLLAGMDFHVVTIDYRGECVTLF